MRLGECLGDQLTEFSLFFKMRCISHKDNDLQQ